MNATRTHNDGEGRHRPPLLLRLVILIAAIGIGAAVVRGVTEALVRATNAVVAE